MLSRKQKAALKRGDELRFTVAPELVCFFMAHAFDGDLIVQLPQEAQALTRGASTRIVALGDVELPEGKQC